MCLGERHVFDVFIYYARFGIFWQHTRGQQDKHEEYEMIERRKDAEFDLWHSILSSDITHFESDIQSKQVSLMGLKLELETIKTAEALEQQKCHMNETDCKKLRVKYITLQKLISRHSLTGHIDENTYNVTIGVSLHYGKELRLNGSIFSNILYFEDIQTIMNIEIVCKEWKYAISNWKGWKDYNISHIWNNRDCLFHGNTNMLNVDTYSSRASSKGSKNEEVYLPRFRRFLLTIETQKNNQFQIEVAGLSIVYRLLFVYSYFYFYFYFCFECGLNSFVSCFCVVCVVCVITVTL